jgi:ankyrin repeat protein
MMKRALFFGLLVVLFSSRLASGEEDCNALVTAAANCDQRAVRILLDAGVSPNCRADENRNLPGSTAPWSLLSSKCQGSAKALEMFISKGYDVNLKNMTPGNKPSSTALHAAAIVGNIEAVQTLLDHGADPSVMDQDNMTALDYAVRFEHSSLVALLASHRNGLRKKSTP